MGKNEKRKIVQLFVVLEHPHFTPPSRILFSDVFITHYMFTLSPFLWLFLSQETDRSGKTKGIFFCCFISSHKPIPDLFSKFLQWKGRYKFQQQLLKSIRFFVFHLFFIFGFLPFVGSFLLFSFISSSSSSLPIVSKNATVEMLIFYDFFLSQPILRYLYKFVKGVFRLGDFVGFFFMV